MRGVNGVQTMASLTSGGVVSAGRDGKLLVWNVSSGDAAPLVSLAGHGDERGKQVTNATNIVGVCEAIGGRIASCGWDGTARVWPAAAALAAAGAAGEPPQVLAHDLAVLAVCALPDGRVATGAGDGIVRLWKTADTGGGYALEAAGASVGCPIRGLVALPGAGSDAQSRRPGGQRRRGPRPSHGGRGY